MSRTGRGAWRFLSLGYKKSGVIITRHEKKEQINNIGCSKMVMYLILI